MWKNARTLLQLVCLPVAIHRALWPIWCFTCFSLCASCTRFATGRAFWTNEFLNKKFPAANGTKSIGCWELGVVLSESLEWGLALGFSWKDNDVHPWESLAKYLKEGKKVQKPSVHQSNNHQKKKKQPGELYTEPRGGYEETSWLVRKNRFPIMRAGEEHPSKWVSMNLHNNNNVLYTLPGQQSWPPPPPRTHTERRAQTRV